MLKADQWQAAVAAGKRRFDLICKKYPRLKAELVLALPSRQIEIESGAPEILERLPELVADTPAKHQALKLLAQKNELEESLKSPNSPTFDAELAAKMKALAKVQAEFWGEYEAELKSQALRLNREVLKTRDYLRELPALELEALGCEGLVQKWMEVERAERDFKKLEQQKRKKAAELGVELERACAQLEYDGQCQVEIRFSELKYELVWMLQGDELVDRKLTPQSKASIRIVLGTLDRFLWVKS